MKLLKTRQNLIKKLNGNLKLIEPLKPTQPGDRVLTYPQINSVNDNERSSIQEAKTAS